MTVPGLGPGVKEHTTASNWGSIAAGGAYPVIATQGAVTTAAATPAWLVGMPDTVAGRWRGLVGPGRVPVGVETAEQVAARRAVVDRLSGYC